MLPLCDWVSAALTLYVSETGTVGSLEARDSKMFRKVVRCLRETQGDLRCVNAHVWIIFLAMI